VLDSRQTRLSRVAGGLLLLVLAGFCTCQVGCVRRRLTIRSNPPGAQVYVDNRPIGKTPVSTPFTYYGTREIRLVNAGYETLTVQQTFPPPWYELPPLDFISENLFWREQRDERVLDFDLVPQRIVPTNELLARAENLRHGARQGHVAPLPEGPPGMIGQAPVRAPAPPTFQPPPSEY